MKHLKRVSSGKRPLKAQNDDIFCGYLFVESNVKCVPREDPLARLLKSVPVP